MRSCSSKSQSDILSTVDTFIAAVPWGESRKVLVFRREHGGRAYTRLRTWNRHTESGFWYPTDRFFVVPVGNTQPLADAIVAAARGDPIERKPSWYKAREDYDREHYDLLVDDDAPDAVIARARRRMMKAR